MLSFNVRSLMKFERRLKFSDCLSTRRYDILCLTETWLTPDVQNYSLFLPANTIYRNDRIPCEHETKHGGVLIAIRSTIMHEQILIDLHLEDFVVISVQTKPQPTLICCLYSPPSDSDYTWSPQQLEILLSKISNHAKKIGYQGVFICGDINFSKTDWNNMSSNSECENAVLDALSEYNFLNYSNLQLDVILANNPDQIVKTDLDTDLYNCYALNGKPCADHLPVSVTVNAFHSELYIPHLVKYAFKKADWDELNKAIVDSPFNPYCFSNLDFLVKKWYEWIFSLIDHFIPKVTRHRSTLPPWVSSRTSHLMKKLATKKKQWVSPVLSKLLKLKKMERQIKEATNEDLKMFETEIFQSRQFSNIQKYLRCVRKSPNVPPVVTLSTQKTETDQEKAKLFNQFFQSVFNEKQHHCITFENRGLNSLLFSETEIQHILEHLTLNKSTGPDNIGNIVLKKCAFSLSKSLLLLFQTISNKGIFPRYWKISQVTPVFKGGNKSDTTCYRPISLLCCVSKVLERLIFNTLYKFCQHRLHENQYGFRKNRSAVVQLLVYLDSIYQKYDDSTVDNLTILYLDFAKAFDKVPHDLLMLKLQSFDIGGKLLQLISSYLSDREQYVKINAETSTPVSVSSGVPQGSILGPLLFLLFINDLPASVSNCESFGFADDFKIIALTQSQLTIGAMTMQNWCSENKMQLNTSKCKLLNIKGTLTAAIDNLEIEPTNLQRDLGLWITSNLTWNDNCTTRTKKGLSALFQLKRNLSTNSTRNSKLNSYVGYVVPVLTYCSQAWQPNKSNLAKFERVQEIATKWILNASFEYKDRLLQLKLLPLSLYVEMHNLLLLISLDRNEYDVVVDLPRVTEDKTRQHTRGELTIGTNRL